MARPDVLIAELLEAGSEYDRLDAATSRNSDYDHWRALEEAGTTLSTKRNAFECYICELVASRRAAQAGGAE